MASRANRRRTARKRSNSMNTKASASAQRRQIAMSQHVQHSVAPALFANNSSVFSRFAAVFSRVRAAQQKHQQEAPAQMEKQPEFVEPTVESALHKSCNGHRLISYDDLPAPWRATPLITSGYRFIPRERLAALLLSMFALHNEFLNIHTHVATFVWTCWNVYPTKDLGETIVFVAVLFCLAASVIGHLMSGCAHQGTMQMCGRIDYIGIVWLICACNASLVFYGYASYPSIAYPSLGVSLLMAVAGSTLPMMSWFNAHEYRRWRILFFMSLEVLAITPIAGIWLLFGLQGMKEFLSPFLRSILLSTLGIVFYSNHLPERFLDPSGKVARAFNSIGLGSHAIWHVLSVLSIVEWRNALAVVRYSFANRPVAA
ncbi:hypothetical protein MIND_01404400 [Mycena indigotica]|uniref:HlyIII-domain-containing protein n=1 Tax=Mycena indigotica TaxID=2126181 RepID=A0A8H6RYG3_9AGAR|nr:uncharacterized protein MIND_01404400 [Mycena indigotica]KAF7288885.1 hypothetical protein MIND_01404400 [Mycena indigotica]